MYRRDDFLTGESIFSFSSPRLSYPLVLKCTERKIVLTKKRKEEEDEEKEEGEERKSISLVTLAIVIQF